MATKSGFSKSWRGFVDHKWSKKRFGTLFAVLLLQTPYQEFVRAIGRSREFPNDIAAWQRHPILAMLFPACHALSAFASERPAQVIFASLMDLR
jgi:hypothetical protein